MAFFTGRHEGWDFWAARIFLILCTGGLCYSIGPFGLAGVRAVLAGCAVALAILAAELRLRQAAIGGFVGAVVGSVVGIAFALPVALVISRTSQSEPTKTFLEYSALFGFGYLGLVLGAKRARDLNPEAFGGFFGAKAEPVSSNKLLDTSVLIDGRIADICETHFLDGTLIVPQFVLRELQMVADSADSLKRQRGRRGLEVLDRMRKMPQIRLQVVDDLISPSAEVDHKLVELARRTGAKIITNDFNLNKVATVQGVAVLNVNQLANALKPVVLPGEAMRVLILREGKEANQGVAYLDDGTMVVVDGARRLINKSIDIIVTSVHQTTAGKMIFGRLEDRSEAAAPALRNAAAAGGSLTNLSPRVEDSSTSRTPPNFPESDAE